MTLFKWCQEFLSWQGGLTQCVNPDVSGNLNYITNNMTEINIEYKEAIPDKYERYLGPYLYEPYAVYTKGLIKGSPKLVLELAAGTGRVTKHIAEKIGSEAKLIATDINPGMLNIAMKKVNSNNVEFLKADTQDLPFPENSFDCVICQFGFMFLPDRQKGFNEAWRVLKPGGQFISVTWDKAENNVTLSISQQTVKSHLKSEPPPFYARGYSMYDPGELQNHLTVAGFSNSKIEKVTLIGECPTAMDAATGFVEGNAIIHEILKDGFELLHTIKKEIVEKINSKVSPDPVKSNLNAWVCEANK
jgi:ubiquinone/menaquinone biosynthesis C-methylase UbiE